MVGCGCTQTILKIMSRFERHDTFSALHHAIALKLFLALLLNTGLTIVVVNAKLNNVTVPPEVGIFSGQFTNFDPNWFTGRADLTGKLSRLASVAMPPFARDSTGS